MHITGFKKWKYCRFESIFPQLWSVCSRSYCDYKKDEAIPNNEHDPHLSTRAERAPVTAPDYSLRLPGLSLSWAPHKSLLCSYLCGSDSSQESEVRVPCTQSMHPLSFCCLAMVVKPSQYDVLLKATPVDKPYQQLMRPFPHPLSGKKRSTLQKESNSEIYKAPFPTQTHS